MSLILWLAGCQLNPFGGVDRRTAAEKIRGVGVDDEQGLQIYGLRNPIVTELMERALVLEKRGRYGDALSALEQALVIEPEAPDILQQMAEVYIEQGFWQAAKARAQQSIELGPRLGHLCKRNWRTLAMAYENTGDRSEANKAAARVPLCERTRPERF